MCCPIAIQFQLFNTGSFRDARRLPGAVVVLHDTEAGTRIRERIILLGKLIPPVSKEENQKHPFHSIK